MKLLVMVPAVLIFINPKVSALVKASNGNHEYCIKPSTSQQDELEHLNDSEIFKPVAFVSYPGSGSRWIAKLIGAAIGFSGSGSLVRILERNNYNITKCSQSNPDMLILLKLENNGMDPYKKLCKEISKSNQCYGGIILLRNPYNSIVSFYNHQSVGRNNTSSVDFVKIIKNNPKEFKRSLFRNLKDWNRLYTKWLRESQLRSRKVLVLRYEDFLKSPELELQKTLKFLKISSNVKDRVTRALRDISAPNTWKRDLSKDTKVFLWNYFDQNGFYRTMQSGLKRVDKFLHLSGYKRYLRNEYKSYGM